MSSGSSRPRPASRSVSRSTPVPINKTAPRIISMDQFRGYTVVGMFVVNFLGSMDAFSRLVGHGDGFFNYGDTIMPSFLFCAGFSYRLTALKRFRELSVGAATWSYLRRSLALIVISLVVFKMGKENPDDAFQHWKDMTRSAVGDYFWGLIKADLWEVLSIIGVCQILLLPIITRSFAARMGAAIGLGLLYLVINFAFDYNFQNGLPNWFNNFFGVHGRRAWDGGLFGVVGWSIPMLAGSLAYDVVTKNEPENAIFKFLIVGLSLMLAGYSLSCLTRLYDRPATMTAEEVKAQKLPEHATDPVIPRGERLKSPGLGWAEVPFFQSAPPKEKRELNFWMMYKRYVTISFTLFSIGCTLVLYCVFIGWCDINDGQIALFRTFGQNPLAAYVIHEGTMYALKVLTPSDSPLLWVSISFAIFFSITWGALHYLEKNKLYFRL